MPAKIQFISVDEKCAERKIVYSDTDLNQHVSKIKYTEWFRDTNDFDFLSTNIIDELEMNFLPECRNGEDISIYKDTITKNMHYGYIARINGNKKVFRNKIKWN